MCATCPDARHCLKRGKRRHIRVDRQDQPQIDWEYPQHSVREKAHYDRHPGVEQAIGRLKVDVHGAHLTHRNAIRALRSLQTMTPVSWRSRFERFAVPRQNSVATAYPSDFIEHS